MAPTDLPILRSEGLYYADGSVVLFATHDGQTHAFRVHKSVLGSHSRIFADMFALPSTSEHEKYDGVDSVDMPDDAKDLEDLLRALYYPSTILSMLENRNPLAAIKYRGILILSKKYFVRVLQKLLRARFRADWPSTLLEWDKLMEQYDTLCTASVPPHDTASQFIDNRMLEPASAICLAREADIPEILPAAFYMLSTISPFMDFDALRSSSPPALTNFEGSGLAWVSGERTARWELLTSSDLMCLMRGRYRLMEFAQKFEQEAGRCACDNLLCIHQISKRRLLNGSALDPLRVLKEISSTRAHNTCHEAVLGLATRSMAARSRLWDNLCYYFGLPDIDEDQNDDDSEAAGLNNE